MAKKAVFLDRDGTINYDYGYISSPSQFKFLPRASQAIKLLKDKDFLVIISTNQSGVARGYFAKKDLERIHQKLKKELKKRGTSIDGIYYCPHHPDQKCKCRKPEIGMFKKAAREHNINLKKSFVVGDKTSDIEAGLKAGCQAFLIGKDIPSLYSAAKKILDLGVKRSGLHSSKCKK